MISQVGGEKEIEKMRTSHVQLLFALKSTILQVSVVYY